MGCGATDGLGAVTAGCGMGCPPRPPRGRWWLADRVDATRYTANNVVTAELGAVPAKDSAGRIAHVVGIYLDATFRFTLADASTSAVPGYDMLAIWRTMFLRDASGWLYFAGSIDGRDIWDDRFVRNIGQAVSTYTSAGARVTQLPADIAANAGAGAVDRDISMYIQLSRFDRDLGPTVEGSIPLAAIQAVTDGFQFTVGTPLGGTYTDVAFTGFQKLNIWLDLVYVDALVVDQPWQLECYTIESTSGSVRHADRTHEFLVHRQKPEDTGGQDLDNFGSSTLMVNGDTIYSSLSMTELTAGRGTMISNDQIGAVPTDNYSAPSSDPSIAFLLPYSHRRGDEAAGQVSFDYASRATATFERFLHRTRACIDLARATAIVNAAGCAKVEAQGYGLDHAGCTCAPQPNRPIALTAPTVPMGQSLYTGLGASLLK